MRRIELNEAERIAIYTKLTQRGFRLEGVCAGQAVNLLKWSERGNLPLAALQKLADEDAAIHMKYGWESYDGTNSVVFEGDIWDVLNLRS